MNSGLYKKLIKAGLMVFHEEAALSLRMTDDAYKIIKPEVIPFISYPYEWCFSQLRDAALTTLKIQKVALEHSMSLKDASAYNIQFAGGKPVFIDTLSFERYQEGEPWVAYRQFCQHFLTSLLLMKYIDPGFNRLLRIHLDGFPLDQTAKLLPFSTKFSLGLLTHIHVHAKSQKHFAGKTIVKKRRSFSKFAMQGFIHSLESLINRQRWFPKGTEWGEYYDDTNYSSVALDHKKKLISNCLDTVAPKILWDLGANDGMFSRIASNRGIQTISFDYDPACVENNYQAVRKNRETNILPLLLDVTNPSPDLGWNNHERNSLKSRSTPDTLMALALIHHLAISNNIPLVKIAAFFKDICKSLIIEWVPKDDSQVQRLLATREDIFSAYTQDHFENDFKQYFDIIDAHAIKESCRVLYLMKVKGQRVN
jgi:hypothetical protein